MVVGMSTGAADAADATEAGGVGSACIVSLKIRGSKITGAKAGYGGKRDDGWVKVSPPIEVARGEEIADLLIRLVGTAEEGKQEFETITRAVRRLFPKATNPKAFARAKKKVLEEKLVRGQEKIEELLLSGSTPEEAMKELGLPWYFSRTVKEIKRHLDDRAKRRFERFEKVLVEKESLPALLEEKKKRLEDIRQTMPFNYRDKLLCPREGDSVLCLRSEKRVVSFRKDCKACMHRIAEEDAFVICEPPPEPKEPE